MQFLTISQIASELQTTESAVIGLIRSGRLEAVDIESRRSRRFPDWRVSHIALADFLRSRSSREVAR